MPAKMRAPRLTESYTRSKDGKSPPIQVVISSCDKNSFKFDALNLKVRAQSMNLEALNTNFLPLSTKVEPFYLNVEVLNRNVEPFYLIVEAFYLKLEVLNLSVEAFYLNVEALNRNV
jgi:hypothetical protein